MKRALVPLANGFEDVEAVAIIDVLRRGGVQVDTASMTDRLSVCSAHGIHMMADVLFEDVFENPYDAIILPGGSDGTENLKNNDLLLERLRRQKAEGGYVCAICAAPTVLEKAGVLDEERVTCYPSCISAMGRPVENAAAIADDQIVTGQGPGSALLFALAVLEQLTDARTVYSVSNGMLVEL